jgi:hypothetical protein
MFVWIHRLELHAQLFNQQSPLPVSREDQIEYIRVFRYLREKGIGSH